MDSTKVASWLQIFGNFGLIAGLILVAVQINQNTEIARAQIVSDAWTHPLNYQLSLMGETPVGPWYKAMTNQELADEDLAVVQAMIEYHWYVAVRNETMYQAGYSLASPEFFAAAFLGEVGHGIVAVAWWDTVASDGFKGLAPETRDAVDRQLAERRVEFERGFALEFSAWKRRVSELQSLIEQSL